MREINSAKLRTVLRFKLSLEHDVRSTADDRSAAADARRVGHAQFQSTSETSKFCVFLVADALPLWVDAVSCSATLIQLTAAAAAAAHSCIHPKTINILRREPKFAIDTVRAIYTAYYIKR